MRWDAMKDGREQGMKEQERRRIRRKEGEEGASYTLCKDVQA